MNKVYNPGSIDLEMEYDPLEMFKASSDGTISRYSLLFKPDISECEIVRRLFFNNVLYNSHESKRALLPALLTTFAGDVPCMEDIKIAIGNRFSRPESAPYPSTCTSQRALELLRRAWRDSRYWFMLDELHFITAACGPKTHLYNVVQSGAAGHELERCRRDEVFDASAVLVAFEIDPVTGCGHFTRLFKATEWEAMQEAAIGHPSGSSDGFSNDTDDESGVSSSSSSSTPSDVEVKCGVCLGEDER